jgi:hypothetical protein
MTFRWPMLAVSILSVAAVTVAPAAAKRHHPRNTYPPARAQVYPDPIQGPNSWDQPHMIQVRPGLWISSWDCITDEGQGRWKPCSTGPGGRGP